MNPNCFTCCLADVIPHIIRRLTFGNFHYVSLFILTAHPSNMQSDVTAVSPSNPLPEIVDYSVTSFTQAVNKLTTKYVDGMNTVQHGDVIGLNWVSYLINGWIETRDAHAAVIQLEAMLKHSCWETTITTQISLCSISPLVRNVSAGRTV